MNSKQKNRVLHFIASDGLYGAERVILNLSEQMKNGYEQTSVIGCIVSNLHEENALYERAISLGIEAVKIVISNKGVLFEIPKAARQIADLNIDIIHSHGYKPSVYGFIISKLKSIPIMATCHLWFELNNYPIKTKFLITLELFFYRWFARLVGVSEPIKQILMDNGLKESNIDVVANGVEVEPLTDKLAIRQKIRDELAVEDDTFVIVNSGRLTKQKAQWVLIEAAIELKKSTEKFVIIIVGEGELQAELAEKITANKLEKHVKMLGFYAEMEQLLAAADCFALPSIDEGMPMSLLEAVSSELPVICTHVGDIYKLITDHESGFVIPLDNPKALSEKTIQLMNDKTLSTTLAKSAKEKMIKLYSSEAMANSYSDIYRSILLAKQ
ncbi:glycosyltransferase family 4 protein [Colwellia sp. 1_MG-2023]|uniref:glycosyltransferase family 4 protein n=1 Tax=Colwellia sp. 1_MG-2023 TaxID=3062649 RepID=UPI0026E23126|nr:glycosyltransferase family 4 protein [Colwellia sp. 1_MG-2023]MDO6444972.1 glycosyltransferase family 4 protein [Colwellia sp. 1_MG-2023]